MSVFGFVLKEIKNQSKKKKKENLAINLKRGEKCERKLEGVEGETWRQGWVI